METIVLCTNYPGIEGVIFEPTYPMIKRNILPIMESILGSPIENSPLIKTFNKGDMLITWQDGVAPDGETYNSKTWLGSLDDPEKAEGQSLDYCHIDEARLVRHLDTALKVIQRRLRGSVTGRNLGYPTMAWITTTPDEPQSTLYNFTENPETRNPSLSVHRVTLFDNEENLPPGYIDEVINAHTGGEYDRFILGLFATVEAGILRFDYSVHVVHDFNDWLVDEQNEPIQKHSNIRHYTYGHDFGWTNPAAQIAIGWDGDGRAYALDEYYKTQSPEEDLIDSAKELQQIYGVGDWHCDPSEPRTIDKLKQANIYAAPYKGKRDDGIRELGSRLRLQGDGKYRLYVHRKCVNLISELQTYDPDKKTRDHAVDALRYGCLGGMPPQGDIQVEYGRRSW
jgi:hypothetical protein